jgi:hypothetical protein
MLISLKRKFIFVANLKTASSAIETVLKPLADIAIADSQFGKHLPFSSIEERFAWIFECVPRREMFIFGVMREPVDFLVSLYNFHSRADFKFMRPELHTGGMDFDAFLSRWCTDNRDQIEPQHRKFLDRDGHIAPNLIVSYPRLKEGLAYVADRIDAPALRTMPTINVSDHVLSRRELTVEQHAWIAETFADDQRFLERFCDRLLMPAEQEGWRNHIDGLAPPETSDRSRRRTAEGTTSSIASRPVTRVGSVGRFAVKTTLRAAAIVAATATGTAFAAFAASHAATDELLLAQAASNASPGAVATGAQRHAYMWSMLSPQDRCIDRQAHRAGTLAYLRVRLNLTAAQRPLWSRLQAAADREEQQQRQICARLKPADSRTIIDRTDARQRLLAARAAALQAEEAPLAALYQALTPEQREILDHGHHRTWAR